jgi:hypothetical protein
VDAKGTTSTSSIAGAGALELEHPAAGAKITTQATSTRAKSRHAYAEDRVVPTAPHSFSDASIATLAVALPPRDMSRVYGS